MTFDEFAAAELPGLARYARVLTGDRQRAHDVLADALVAAQLRWKRIGTMEHPAAYVRRIVTTTFLAEKRRWSTRHIGLTGTGDAPVQAAPDPAASVDDRDLLRQLLLGLPRHQRAAIVLRHYLGLADSEIAEELGCAPATVRAYISRGLAALRVGVVSGGDRGDADDGAGAPSGGDGAPSRGDGARGGGAAGGGPGRLVGGGAVSRCSDALTGPAAGHAAGAPDGGARTRQTEEAP